MKVCRLRFFVCLSDFIKLYHPHDVIYDVIRENKYDLCNLTNPNGYIYISWVVCKLQSLVEMLIIEIYSRHNGENPMRRKLGIEQILGNQ